MSGVSPYVAHVAEISIATFTRHEGKIINFNSKERNRFLPRGNTNSILDLWRWFDLPFRIISHHSLPSTPGHPPTICLPPVLSPSHYCVLRLIQSTSTHTLSLWETETEWCGRIWSRYWGTYTDVVVAAGMERKCATLARLFINAMGAFLSFAWEGWGSTKFGRR
jgi:hypothetical protein